MEFSAGQTVRSGWCPFSAAVCVFANVCMCMQVCSVPSTILLHLLSNGDFGSVDALNFLFLLCIFFSLYFAFKPILSLAVGVGMGRGQSNLLWSFIRLSFLPRLQKFGLDFRGPFQVCG